MFADAPRRLSGGCWLVLAVATAAAGREPPVTRLSPHLAVFHGPVNTGIVLDGDRALLIDCGDGRVARELPALGVARVAALAFTHDHRDQLCGAGRFTADGARVLVPAGERESFDHPERFWNDPRQRWHNYSFRPSRLMPIEPLAADDVLTGGQTLDFGPARIRVLDTPGHTDGSISLQVEVDGRRTMFCGDAIFDAGQVWDLHSLQKGFTRGQRTIYDYHGFMGARWMLADSLRRIRDAGADLLVPSHGRIMTDPARAIDLLLERLEACYDRYVAVSALRHYFPELFTEYAGRTDHMPARPGIDPPDFLRHVDTTWIIVSQDQAAFVMDCRNEGVIRAVRDLLARGEVNSVEGLWITHYHDDHVDAIPDFLEAFGCPCLTERSVAQVVGRPAAWGLPCMSPSVIRVDRPAADGQSWTWREFRMTAFHLPGQTEYHAGLFVEGRGLRMLFAGDSFTPAGIDDYCMHNRNLLGAGVGFDRCLKLIERLQPTHIFNCHVDQAFSFTAAELAFMRANLADRQRLFGQIVPWEHANFGTDAHWVRCDPYEQTASAGSRAVLEVVIANHAAEPRSAAARPAPPASWRRASPGAAAAAGGETDGPWRRIEVPAGGEGRIPLEFALPADLPPGRHPVAVDVCFGDRVLPQWTAAILVTTAPAGGAHDGAIRPPATRRRDGFMAEAAKSRSRR